MRARRRAARALTAEQVVRVARGAEIAGASLEVRNHAMRQALAEYGYTPLDYFRARYWIRRGKPAEYGWDDW